MTDAELLLTRASWTKGRETGRQNAEEEAQASSGSRRERAQSRVESHGRGQSRPVGELRWMTTVAGRSQGAPEVSSLGTERREHPSQKPGALAK